MILSDDVATSIFSVFWVIWIVISTLIQICLLRIFSLLLQRQLCGKTFIPIILSNRNNGVCWMLQSSTTVGSSVGILVQIQLYVVSGYYSKYLKSVFLSEVNSFWKVILNLTNSWISSIHIDCSTRESIREAFREHHSSRVWHSGLPFSNVSYFDCSFLIKCVLFIKSSWYANTGL